MNNLKGESVQLTNFAVKKVQEFIKVLGNNNENLKFRVYIIGGGCGGFQYGFTLDTYIHKDDYIFQKNGVDIVIDPMSLQYLSGGIVDYYEGLEGSRFTVVNPHAKTVCSCGSSFSV